MVTYPSPATFNCSAFGFPRPNITWVNPNSAIIVSGVNGIFITVEDIGTRGRVSTLHLTLTAPSVSGQYTCLAAVDNGNISRASAILTIYGK